GPAASARRRTVSGPRSGGRDGPEPGPGRKPDRAGAARNTGAAAGQAPAPISRVGRPLHAACGAGRKLTPTLGHATGTGPVLRPCSLRDGSVDSSSARGSRVRPNIIQPRLNG